MRYTLHENLESYVGTISNTQGFLHRYLDTGFKTKWSGFWSPPYKYLDYFSVKINGIWLGPDTLQATEYGEKMVFHHETDSLEVKEIINVPEDSSGFKMRLEVSNTTEEKKATHVGVETGVDIRHRTEDIGPENYRMEKEVKQLDISKNNRKLRISTDQKFELKGDSYIKEHEPREPQRCFIPGILTFREEVSPGSEKTFKLKFFTSDTEPAPIDKVEQSLQEHNLGRCFENSVDSLENLIYDKNGIGIIAGHPWFQNYWARDAFWSVLGLIDAGQFELSERILENFAERGLPGKINLDGSDEQLERSDTEPLFIIACDKLERHYQLSETLEDAMAEAMNELELEGNTVDHAAEGTWMDTLRRGKAVDIQSLWLKAADIMEDERKERLEEGLREFKTDKGLKDGLDNSFQTVNVTIPLMFDQIDKETTRKQLEHINGEFFSQYGARTRAVTEPGYDSSGYHTGSSWGLTTGWAAIANFQYGNYRHGENFLEKLVDLMDRDQPGALPEVVDSESGRLLGCQEQAWSAGIFVHAVDTYLLGIKVEKDKVKIDPAPEISCKRTGKRVRGEEIDLEFRNGEVEVLNNPDLQIET